MNDRLGGAKRILAIRLDTIGDVIMTAPALTALRAHGARVTLLTSSLAAPLAPMLPGLAEVVALDVPWMKHTGTRRDYRAHQSVIEHLMAKRFDAAVVFNVSTQDPSCAAYLAYECAIPRVAGYSTGKPYGLFTDPIEDTDSWPPSRHEVRRQLDLTAALGFEVPATTTGITAPRPSPKVSRLLSGLAGRRWCLLHPGASAQSRRYSVERWSRVVDMLAERGVRTVIAGGDGERLDINDLVMGCESSPRRVDGELALSELAALTAAAPVAITCNSAAAHMAAALDTPVVTLYAGTNPQHTPYSGRATVLRKETDCAWCLSSTCAKGDPVCIWDIEPAQIVEAAASWVRRRTPVTAERARLAAPA